MWAWNNFSFIKPLSDVLKFFSVPLCVCVFWWPMEWYIISNTLFLRKSNCFHVHLTNNVYDLLELPTWVILVCSCSNLPIWLPGAKQCSQCKGNGINSVDHFNGQFKAGGLCWLCRYAYKHVIFFSFFVKCRIFCTSLKYHHHHDLYISLVEVAVLNTWFILFVHPCFLSFMLIHNFLSLILISCLHDLMLSI